MKLGAPELDASGSQLADWLELSALIANTVSFDELNISNELLEEGEPPEIDDENLFSDARKQLCATTIGGRRKTVESSYPFSVSNAGNALSATTPPNIGADSYVFCLLASNLVPGAYLDVLPDFEALARSARSLMQVCSTLAVAGHQDGPAFSLGWPRADDSSFLNKLRSIYAAYGEGTIVEKIPKGAPEGVKDDGIDVIGWKRQPDGLPGQSYMLFQAAAGKHWDAKSTAHLRNLFHGTWFDRQPASAQNSQFGIAIPFAMAEEDDAEVRDGRFRRMALEFGEVLYRLRLPHFVSKGVEVSANNTVDDIARVEEIRAFNTQVIQQMRA